MFQACMFCDGDASEKDHYRHCDGRQGRQEAAPDVPQPSQPPPRRPGVTRSTDEAMTLLHQTRQRWIALARDIAVEQIRARGRTTSRAVFAEMEARGLLEGSEHTRAHWLGAVFNSRQFRWTGDWYSFSDSVRNIHERTVKVWTLAPETLADAAANY